MSTAVQTINKSTIIKWIVLIAIAIIIMVIPANEMYTPEIKKFIAITVSAILWIAFELTDTFVPAVLMPTLYYVTGIVPATAAFAGWTQSTAWMIIGAFLLANVLHESGILNRVAYFCLKHLGGNFNGVLYGLFITGCVLEFVSVNSAYAIIVTLGYGVCVALKLEPKSKPAACVMMASCFGAFLPTLFLYRAAWAGIIQNAAQTIDPNFVVLWHHFPLYNAPGVLMGFIIIFAMTKIFKTSKMGIGGTKEYFSLEYQKMGKMQPREIKAALLLAFILTYVITAPLHQKSVAIVFMIVPYLGFLPGINIASVESIKRLNIGTIFFVVSMLGIASAGQVVGVNDLISQMLSPIAMRSGVVGTTIIVLLFGTAANMILTPAAIVSSLTPLVIQVCGDLGASPWGPVMALIYSTTMYFLPHEVSGVLLMYSFGYISMSDFIKIATLQCVVIFICFVCIQIPWYGLMGIL